MAVKNPNRYPRWSVLAWVVDDKEDNGYSITCIDVFDNEDDAVALYDSIHVDGQKIAEVIIELNTSEDSRDIRQKDETGELDC